MSKKFTDLVALTTPATDDILPIDDLSASTTKKITVADLLRTTGGLTAQYMSNPYKFSAYQSATQNIAASGTAKILLQAENYDTGSNFDSITNYRFVAPITGFYQFTGSTQMFVANTVVVQCFLYKNGVALREGNTGINASGGNNNTSSVVTGSLQLTAGDYIELFTFHSQASVAGTVAGSSKTYLDGFLVSAS